MTFVLTCKGWSFDADLQIIHADVYMEAEGEIVIDEPLCVDVGLPALLLSAKENVTPDRWANANEWHRMPFFVCGCGDPECRGYSFIVKHQAGGERIELVEVEEKPSQPSRELGRYTVAFDEYVSQVEAVGRAFLDFVQPLAYKPYYQHTVETVKRLLGELEAARRFERN
ncbi:hypothetical protein ACFQI7_26515 [Paenibacillus allorhizosphaerae]|uniref:Post-SET domain-containing protein n=1 Tax=Paenibacillus allorhizosphaerae TaxID=2849866 RepID=A0ABM8VM93_9BACL|nr:hypothetical protein [Paenibacillus allorhizosphaerae]CAG7649477.1 hypothetical protein PAECIP111802_04499 [Paenibacillus allorhizosphaerae]